MLLPLSARGKKRIADRQRYLGVAIQIERDAVQLFDGRCGGHCPVQAELPEQCVSPAEKSLTSLRVGVSV